MSYGCIKETLESNKDELVSLYLDGASTCELGRKYGCSNGSVWKFLEHNKIPIRQTKVVAPNFDEIIRLHKTGLSAYAITKKLGLTKNAAERAIRIAGFDISSNNISGRTLWSTINRRLSIGILLAKECF